MAVLFQGSGQGVQYIPNLKERIGMTKMSGRNRRSCQRAVYYIEQSVITIYDLTNVLQRLLLNMTV